MTITQIEKVIEEMATYMTTGAYAERQRCAEADVVSNAEAIVAVIPDSEASIALLLQLHGNRFVLTQNLSEFETSLASLRAKLLEMKERQTQPE